MKRIAFAIALAVIAATLGIHGQLTGGATAVAQLNSETPEATATPDTTPTPTVPAATPEPDITPAPTPQDGPIATEATITVRFVDDMNGNHALDAGEPPVEGCPAVVVDPPGPGFDLPPGAAPSLLDPPPGIEDWRSQRPTLQERP